MSHIYTSADQLIGRTPLLELTHLEKKYGLKARILAKLEYLNPAGSVKDRIARAMIDDAEAKGLLHEGSVIIEPTSGNTGIGLASVAAARGYRVIIVMPETMSVERRQLMKAYGAELVLTEGSKGMKGAIAKAEELSHEIPGSFVPGQFVNAANPKAHFETTGPEIWQDAGGNVDVLVCMAGTGGTGSGTARYLRSRNPGLRVVLVQPHPDSRLTPEHPDVQIIDGVLPAYGVPEEELSEYLTPDWSDEYINVRTAEAYATAHDVLHTEGLFLGTSAAAALHAAVQVGQRAEYAGKSIAVILPDNGMKYLSTPMYQQTI